MIKKYLLILVLVFSFAVAPTVSADTVSDLQAQIGAILTQIASLKAQIDASQVSGNSGGSGQASISLNTTTTASSSCFSFDKSLRVGDKGTDVLVLHRILKKEGFTIPTYAENGIDGAPIFDEITASSVVAFQEKYASEILTPNGLSHGTGFVGVSTREKLNKLSSCDQPVVTQTPVCYVFSNNLAIGSTGEDVTALQTWLIAKGYDIPGISLGQVAKGYFGPSTAAAVSKLQKDKGIAGDLGSFGPLTRQLVTCLSSENDKSSITVLSPNGGETWTKGTTQTIKWQDNRPYPTCPVGVFCTSIQRYFDVKLVPYYESCKAPTSVSCTAHPQMAPYIIASRQSGNSYSWDVGRIMMGSMSSGVASDGKYTIQVCAAETDGCDSSDSYFTIATGYTNNNSPKIGIISALPTNIQPGQAVNFYLSATDADNDDLSWSVDWGEGEVGGSSCSVVRRKTGTGWAFSKSHSWAQAGTYQVKISVSDCVGGSDSYSFSVTVGRSSNRPPVISGIVAPTVLNVNQVGTWKVSASDPENGTLSYSVVWGDEPQIAYSNSSLSTGTTFTQGATFTHSYDHAGTYTSVFTVKDDSGQSAQTSVTVKVGNITALPTLTVSLLSSTDDMAGIQNVFKPGPGKGWGGSTADSADWNFSSVLDLPTDRTVSYVTLRQTNGEYWSTNNAQYFPLVIVNDDNKNQLNSAYTNSLGNFPAGQNRWHLYGQKNTLVWVGGSLTITFSDGSTVSVNIPAQAQPTITVTSPNGGETYKIGDTVNIKWSSNITSNYYVTSANLDSKSIDPIVSNISDTSYSWTIPSNFLPGRYKISVANGILDSTATVVDSSDSYFTITVPLSKVSPCGNYGDVDNDGYLTEKDIEIIRQDVLAVKKMTPEQRILADVSNEGNVSTLDIAFIRAYLLGTKTTFPICSVQPSITVLSPNGGETWMAGGTQTITWKDNSPIASCKFDPTSGITTCPKPTAYDIKLSFASGSPCSSPDSNGNRVCAAVMPPEPRIIASGVSGFSYNWIVASVDNGKDGVSAGEYRLLICQSGTTVCDSSDRSFTITLPITQPSITIISPNGGESYRVNDMVRITWSVSGIVSDTEKVYLISESENGNKFNFGSTYVKNGWGWYDWVISPNYTGKYRILISEDPAGNDAGDILDMSNSYFTISAPLSKVSPCGNYGDVDNDGYLTEKDITMIRQDVLAVKKMTQEQKVRADVNNDSTVTATDITWIRGYLMGTKVAFPICSVQSPSTQSVTLVPGNDHYFKVESGTLTFGDVSNGGFPSAESRFIRGTELYVFSSGNEKPERNKSVSATYYILDGKWYIYGGTITEIPATTPIPAYFIIRHRAIEPSKVLTLPSNVTFFGSALLNHQPKLWDATVPNDDDIMENIGLAILNQMTTIPTSVVLDFDFNDDGKILVNDSLIILSVRSKADDAFDKVYKKMMVAITNRLNLTSADSSFVAEFDVDKDGTITLSDKERISKAMIGTRVYN